jgi:hypothetical protein
MTEAELRELVIGEADRLGLLWHYCREPRRCGGPRGFPDLFVAGPRGLALIELKTATGETSPGQDRWAWTLARGGREYYRLWRPADLDAGEVRALLERLA